MMGRYETPQPSLFYTSFNLDKRIRPNHPLRKVAKVIDFGFVFDEVEHLYGTNGNVSVPPPALLKLLVLLMRYNVRSEREMMDTLPERLDWLWFLGYDLDSEIPHHRCAGGPDGRPAEFVEAKNNHAIEKEVSRVLHRLIKEESIKSEEIAVLTGHSLEKSVFADKEKIGAFSVTHNQHPESGKIYVNSIRRFKGLERLVVILVALEAILDSPDILYVGMTRAKAHLVVVGDDKVIEAVKGV